MRRGVPFLVPFALVSVLAGLLPTQGGGRAAAEDAPAAPGPAPAPGKPPPPRHEPGAATPVDVRFVRRGPGGAVEDVAVTGRAAGYGQWVRGDDLKRWSGSPNRIAPGDRGEFEVDDPSGVAGRVRVAPRAGDPASLVVQLPRADDPRLDAFTVVVRDATTGRPIPGATLHLFPYGDTPRRLVADAEGRIAVAETPRATPGPGRSLFARLDHSGTSVHHPAYAPWSFGWGHDPLYAVHADRERVVDARLLNELVGTGLVTVTLHPARWSVRPTRLRAADGGVVANVAVLVYPAGAAAARSFGAGIERYDVQVAGPEGDLVLPTSDLLGLDVRVRGVAVATIAVPGGPIPEVRLPPLAEVTIVLDGVPPGTTWALDELGYASTPTDPPLVPVTYLRGAKEVEREAGAEFGRADSDATGHLAAGRATLTLPIPVGLKRRVLLDVNGAPRGVAGFFHVVEVTPSAPGPARIERRFEDLPEAPWPPAPR